MSTVQVYFEHLRYVFPDEQLIRYGSPYFDIRTAGLDLIKFFNSDVVKINDHTAAFDPRQLLCANEAFPEAALADPLSDLEVWDDWRTGLRAFPYPGTYSKLGITQQESKTSASSSVGVLGEIMAGIYAQAGIAPWVLVRVIRHWPDFIFSLRHNRYAFVEAKAFTTNDAKHSSHGIPHSLLGECLAVALQQLNADPYVQVWGAFTHIEQITPLTLHVIFLECDTNDARRNALAMRVLPDVVVTGLAERALGTSLNRMEPEYIQSLTQGGIKLPRHERRKLESALIAAAMDELEGMLIDQELKVIMLQSREAVERQLTRIVKRVRTGDGFKTKRLFSVLGDQSREGLARVRSLGAGTIYAGKLTMSDYVDTNADWTRDWEKAPQEWGAVDRTPIWRCGGALLAITESDLEGRVAVKAS